MIPVTGHTKNNLFGPAKGAPKRALKVGFGTIGNNLEQLSTEGKVKFLFGVLVAFTN
jgi:hypothetical protein